MNAMRVSVWTIERKSVGKEITNKTGSGKIDWTIAWSFYCRKERERIKFEWNVDENLCACVYEWVKRRKTDKGKEQIKS